jgi:hypothetical protein
MFIIEYYEIFILFNKLNIIKEFLISLINKLHRTKHDCIQSKEKILWKM